MAVILSTTTDRRQWVSLECAINPGSFPKPIITWLKRTTGDSGDGEVVEEDEQTLFILWMMVAI